ncbi:hypothetical protein CMI37_06355 [Candidatus Pacearchaeota archaeon]|nr:hypothetical protein [Candidatus Pacearchaeota archaeon]
MPFLPADFIGGDLHWLLDFVVKDTTLRFSRVPVSATLPDGEEWDYQAGLEFSEEFEDGINPFGSTPSEHSVEITLHASLLVDVAGEIMKGYDLAAARGKLWLYEKNSKSAVLFLDGVVRSVEWGSIEEPITFSLEEVIADDAGLFPPPLAVIDRTSWPNAVEDVRGERYPWIFGAPGKAYSASAAVAYGYGSPAFLVDDTGGAQKLLIAGHHVAAGRVTLINDETGSVSATSLVTNDFDGRGHPIAWCDVASTGSGGGGAAEPDDKFFIKWHNYAGTEAAGVMMPDGTGMYGAGDVLRYMLSFSRLRIDHGRLAAAIPQLNQFRIDTAICCGPDERFTPWEWIEDHLSSILPVSWRISTGDQGGHYPVYWRFDATSHDAVANITATAEAHAADSINLHSEVVAGTAYRDGMASFSPRSEVANEFTLDFQGDFKDGAYWGRRTLTGDHALAAQDDSVGSNFYCHISRTRYRGPDNLPQTVSMELTTDVVWDEATATAVLSWMSRRHAIQSIFVSYIVDAEVACHLEPGDMLLVTDAELKFTEYLFMVEQITWRSDRFLGLDLRSLTDAARDMLGA